MALAFGVFYARECPNTTLKFWSALPMVIRWNQNITCLILDGLSWKYYYTPLHLALGEQLNSCIDTVQKNQYGSTL